MVPIRPQGHKKNRALILLIPLLLVNAGVAHLLVRQIAIRANAETKQVLDDTASLSPEAPAAPVSEAELALATDNKPLITTYTVVAGDTLSQIAERFGISTNTIRWANDLTPTSTIRVGQKLTILPVTGMQYTVAKGDTISGIAVRFNAKQSDILDFNNLDSADKIKPGLELIIPEGTPVTPPKPVKTTKTATTTPKKTETKTAATTSAVSTKTAETPAPANVSAQSTGASESYFINPIPGAVLSQGLHDGTAVDLAAQSGTNVRAAAAGTVITAKDSNTWNGGYGYYIVIQHDNGTSTLYSHLSRIDVEVGDSVDQGEHIGLSGRTGHVTGPHLHFEVRGAKNPFANDKLGTKY